MIQQWRLLIDEQGLSIWQRRRNGIERIQCCAPDEHGLDEFSRFLTRHRDDSFLILTNLSEEQYYCEAAAGLTGREAKILAESRCRRHYPETPWRYAAISQAPDRSHLLAMMAINLSPTLNAWLARLRQAESALTALTSLPALLPALLARDAPNAPPLLVYTQHTTGNRITLLQAGLPCASRWSNSDEQTTLAEEGQRLLLPFPELRQTVAACHLGADNWPLPSVNEIKPERPATGHDAVSACLMLPTKAWLKRQFAPADWRLHAHHRRIGRGLFGLGIGILLAGTATAGWQQQQLDTHRATLATSTAQLDELQRKLTAIPEAAVPPALSSPQLAQFIEQHPKLQAQRQTFVQDLLQLSRILDRHPLIHLEEINWSVPEQAPITSDKREFRISIRLAQEGVTANTLADFLQELQLDAGDIQRLLATASISANVSIAIPQGEAR